VFHKIQYKEEANTAKLAEKWDKTYKGVKKGGKDTNSKG
jgi:hypothetical protein